MDEWTEITRALEEMTASGNAEVHEDGEWLAELAGLHCEIHRAGKHPLVHLWSDEKNLTRRLLAIKESSPDRIILEVQRFGRPRPGRLEFRCADSPRMLGRVSREQFRARLRRMLAEQFPDSSIDSLTAAPDLEHSFSGLYVRGRMHEGVHEWAFLAVSSAESAAAVDGILAFGILWLDWVRGHASRRAIEGLRLFVPQGTSLSLCERSLALGSAARTEIFEIREPDGRVEGVDQADAGNLESWLAPRREIESMLAAAAESVARTRSIVPAAGHAIEPRVEREPGDVAICFRGLEFARWSAGQMFFGLGDSRERLSGATQPSFERLVHSIDRHRNSHSEDTNHPLYRSAPERWLEAAILEDPARLDATLDPEHLYSQVPALAGRDRGILDLLGVTRRGRLVVIELKASEDIQMPVQAADYWLRVRRLQRAGDFERCGYFSGMELDPRPPLVWLVAPGLRFHSATDILLKYLSSEIQITRIGVNENWRRGLRIVFRQ